ncbi:MAG TPA: cupredoxin domain-containing protein [Terriglobia bacterium]|nr:cupredoxin domain-containing protein [Terriglobia bacterium]
MIRLKESRFLFLILLAFLALAGAASTAQNPPAAKVNLIRMTARKYQFDPSVITVRKGDHVKLVITALDHDHGIEIAGYGIKQKLKKGIPTTVEFTADKPGTFEFRCSQFCGLGHRRMKGKLVVQED